MHIPDGLVPAPVAIGGYALTGLATWYSLRQINRRPEPTAGIPKAALLTAAFFVASSIHVPIPPASVHLVLNGLLGVVLGYYAFPAILIGLFFQAVMFGHGGLTTLGVNAAMMGIPALLAYHLFRVYPRFEQALKPNWAIACFAFLAGAFGLGLATLIFLILIITTIPAGFDAATEQTAVYGLAIAHIPLMILEGIFTAMLVLFLRRVKPELLKGEI
ncbi:cobalt transporter CbiM [Thermocoleostomius sinensis]|jgi:cobalt/nickel transport system permease protein|uniref:Cobalt transporter CbiM n=1 Tax=Thermocoleostomius sinensis A174 TaxID=2016057 RepID=A0A9E8ZBH2_9CYAN|nr:cobalt transporter CbiM [Thermocoleostomius sinensis]WAL58343.1 cobalt transporter CbiM [Thermocoleostomius sinensis A174]